MSTEQRNTRHPFDDGRDLPTAPLGVAGASAEVMYKQLTYLMEMSRRPNITVQVVPHSADGH